MASGISTVFSGLSSFEVSRHEVHAALNDDLGVDLGSVAGELQRIADDVGNTVKNVRRLVVVRQDDGVALFLQPVDRMHVGCIGRPLECRNEVLDLLVEMLGLAGDRRRVSEVGPLDDAVARSGADERWGGCCARAKVKTGHRALLSRHFRLLIMLKMSIIRSKQKRLSRRGLI
ncbi:hypothetical protein ABIA23_003283 [Sinorhizobium fredii]